MIKAMSSDEFYQLNKSSQLNVVDVREVDEYNMGHIPNAANLPLSELGERYNELDKSKSYYIICAMGGRSSQASQFLAHQGFDVTNVMGGMSAYKGEVVS